MHRPLIVFACLAAVAAGCGGDDGERAQRAPLPVVLKVTVEVRGTVEPARAEVLVLGQEAAVSGGTFTAEVPLAPGANVIDVMATARGRGPAMTAVRVTRELPVEVPDLGGLDLAEAQEQAAAAGLELEVTEGGGLFDDLLPGEPAVCDQDPSPGEEVRRGTTVQVEVRRAC
jgi:hypothetical protein